MSIATSKLHDQETSGHKDRDQANARLRERAGEVRDDLQGLARAAGDAAAAQLDPVEDYVRRNPVKSLLMAAGAGALVGMLFLRR